MKRVLFAGESWSAMTMEIKGFNNFFASRYETGLGYIDKAIEAAGYAFEFMPSHVAADKFPYTMEELKEKIYSGEIEDAKTVSALLAYEVKYCK